MNIFVDSGVILTVEKQKKLLINVLFYAAMAIILYFGFKALAGPLLPFAIAFVLAAALQGIIRWLIEKFNFRKGFSSVFTVLGVYTLFGSVSVWLIRALYRQLSELLTALPQYSEKISSAFSYIIDKVNLIFGSMPDGFLEDIPATALESCAQRLADAVSGFATDLAKGIPSFLLSFAVTVIAGIYFAKDYDKIITLAKQSLPQKLTEKAVFIKEVMLKKLAKLIKGYLIIIGMTFFELLIGLGLLNVKYALIIAAVTAIVDILPVLGCGTVLVPWAVLSALTGNTGRAIGLVVLYAIITVMRNVTEPKIIGNKLGVHPVLILAAVFLGLKLLGGVGVIVAPIAVVIIKTFLENRRATLPTPSE